MACAPHHNNTRSRNHRRTHSRSHHQQDSILDFLSSLDKNKTTSPWQTEVNQVNEDWVAMMQVKTANNEEESLKENKSNKNVTWRENLLDIKTISPRQSKMGKVNFSENATLSSPPFSRSSNHESLPLFNWKVW